MTSAIHEMGTANKLRKVLLICGILAALVQVGTDILAGVLYPGYSFTSQAISEQSAIGAPTRALLLPFGPIYGGLQIAFGLGIWLLAGQRRALSIIGILQIIIGIVAIAWMPFPIHMRGEQTTFTDTMHNTFAGVQTLFILTSLGLGTIAYGKKWFGYYSLATLVTLLAVGSLSFMIAGHLVPQEIGNWFGIFERITVHGYMLWVIILAIVLLREERGRAMLKEFSQKH